jgi:hypothetical protein
MRRTAVALLLLLSGTVAAVAQAAPATQSLPKQAAKPAEAKQALQQSGPCAVGVISQLGEKFTVRKVGLTVFGNESNDVPVESWHIDDLVVAKISGVLGKRAGVRRISFHKEAFASLQTVKLFRDTDAEVGEGVRTLAAGTRCARYVRVTRGTTGYGMINQILGGLGIVAGKKPYFTGDLYNLHALITVRVYDGETFTLLKRKMASTGQSTFMAMIGGPHREVDESFWPESPNAAVQNAKLREATRELVAQSLDATLPELPLAP